MSVIKHNPPQLFPPYKNYSHAVEAREISRVLFISGLNGYLQDGISMPESFKEQGQLIWEYMGVILTSASMDYGNIVSLRTYLASPDYDEENVALRVKYLGENQPASTVICCQLLNPIWKLEIEAVATA
ncbi:MAG: RidA family protein [Cyanobacteria bacterium P01_A01_bin.137]